jgi:nitrate reductase delta subunit
VTPPAVLSRPQLTWQVASLLLAYPDERLHDQLPLLREAVTRLPAEHAAPLQRFLEHADATPLLEMAAAYVATFDH